jgi:hypothetical protein
MTVTLTCEVCHERITGSDEDELHNNVQAHVCVDAEHMDAAAIIQALATPQGRGRSLPVVRPSPRTADHHDGMAMKVR